MCQKFKDITLTIVRNKQGNVNILEVRENLKGRKSKPAPGAGQPEKKETPKPGQDDTPPQATPRDPDKKPAQKTSSPSRPLPGALVHNALLNAHVDYIDHKLSDDPFRISLDLVVDAHNISTYDLPDKSWGQFHIKGHQTGNPDSMVIDIQGQLAPLTDPVNPSLDVKGTVLEIDLSTMTNLARSSAG